MYVVANVGSLADTLLWGGVKRSMRPAHTRHQEIAARCRTGVGFLQGAARGQAADAEVRDAKADIRVLPITRGNRLHEDVCRFQITMDNWRIEAMKRADGSRQLPHQVSGPREEST